MLCHSSIRLANDLFSDRSIFQLCPVQHAVVNRSLAMLAVQTDRCTWQSPVARFLWMIFTLRGLESYLHLQVLA
jgi:hypothetical protein